MSKSVILLVIFTFFIYNICDETEDCIKIIGVEKL